MTLGESRNFKLARIARGIDDRKNGAESNLPSFASVEGYDNTWREVIDDAGEITLHNTWEVHSNEFPRIAIA